MNNESRVELCGHKGKISNITGYVAQPPFRLKDILSGYIEFDEPHPAGIGAINIDIPAKEYSQRELIDMIKREGEKLLTEAMKQRIKERTMDALRQQRQEAVKALAEKAAKLLE